LLAWLFTCAIVLLGDCSRSLHRSGDGVDCSSVRSEPGVLGAWFSSSVVGDVGCVGEVESSVRPTGISEPSGVWKISLPNRSCSWVCIVLPSGPCSFSQFSCFVPLCSCSVSSSPASVRRSSRDSAHLVSEVDCCGGFRAFVRCTNFGYILPCAVGKVSLAARQ
jgi:hypothetical protein